MLCLAYLSSVVPPLSDDAIEELLRKSRANNARQQITGLLLYADGNVLQVLEGPDAEVEDLFRRISAPLATDQTKAERLLARFKQMVR